MAALWISSTLVVREVASNTHSGVFPHPKRKKQAATIPRWSLPMIRDKGHGVFRDQVDSDIQDN